MHNSTSLREDRRQETDWRKIETKAVPDRTERVAYPLPQTVLQAHERTRSERRVAHP